MILAFQQHNGRQIGNFLYKINRSGGSPIYTEPPRLKGIYKLKENKKRTLIRRLTVKVSFCKLHKICKLQTQKLGVFVLYCRSRRRFILLKVNMHGLHASIEFEC